MGRKKLVVTESKAVGDVVKALLKQHDYAASIADFLDKDPTSVLGSLVFLENEGFVVSEREKDLNKKVYKLVPEKFVEEYFKQIIKSTKLYEFQSTDKEYQKVKLRLKKIVDEIKEKYSIDIPFDSNQYFTDKILEFSKKLDHNKYLMYFYEYSDYYEAKGKSLIKQLRRYLKIKIVRMAKDPERLKIASEDLSFIKLLELAYNDIPKDESMSIDEGMRRITNKIRLLIPAIKNNNKPIEAIIEINLYVEIINFLDNKVFEITRLKN